MILEAFKAELNELPSFSGEGGDIDDDQTEEARKKILEEIRKA